MAKIKLRAFPTFVLRTPLFPLSALDDPERTMQQPCFREALYLASPDLYTFTGDKTEDAEEKGDAAALKYFLRACSRCTPFGLFAGCSTGRFGSSTQIAVAEPTAARRTTRLDMQYLCALIQRIERHGAVRRRSASSRTIRSTRSPDSTATSSISTGARRRSIRWLQSRSLPN